jgi:organic radical activating enzyme
MTNEEQFDKKPFCILPFIHLATHPIGTVTPCCITDMDNDMSTSKKDGLNMFLDKDPIEEIANSVNFKEVRRKMISGEFPSECKTCYFYEKNKIYSKRMESNLKFAHLIDEALENTEEDGTLKSVNYKYIELRLGTVCNLKCVTCNPFSSNRWNEDVDAFKDTEFEKNYFRCDIRTEWFRSQTFYDELLTKCDGLEEVWINGGEPTLIKEHAYFLEKLIEDGRAKNVNLHYSINMWSIPDKFIEIWKKFKHVRLHLSIDDIGERNDYIRHGSKWTSIMNSFDKILQYRDVFKLEVCQTVSCLNVSNIDEFKKFFNQYNMVIAHNYVHHPSFLHVSILPTEMKQDILNNLVHLREDERLRLEAELLKETKEEEFEKFKSYINLLDKKRNNDIRIALPEWKNLI